MRWPWRRFAAAVRAVVATALLLVPALTFAQQGTPPVGRGDGGRRIERPASADTLRRAPGDTTRAGRDSTQQGQRELIKWVPNDSTMDALLKRAGYRATRYQADTVGFDARTRTMTLGTRDTSKAAVEREGTVLVSRKLVYNDSTHVVAAQGDTIVLRDPARGEDIIGIGEMTYDVERKVGRTQDVSTVASSGADWRVEAHRATFASDSTTDRNTFWGRDGIITSCLDSVPHFHFEARELKRVSNSVLVARPAILYVQGVPVAWLPFIFQDIRSGRRSGILTPRLGVAEIVRNSPTYRRTIENLGYYVAINEYMDATVSMDWRSGARATDVDPGWTNLEGTFNYRWLDRFLSGGIGVSQRRLTTGTRNFAVSWSHQQEFSTKTRFTTNLNYVSNTTVQRQTSLNPNTVLATIASQANLVRQQGPFTINLGGTQRQYPGRQQVDRSFPSLNVSSRPLTAGDWFVVTPTLQYSGNAQLDIDAAGDFAWRYRQTPSGLDSTRLRRDARTRNLSFGLPFKLFDFQVQADLRANEVANDFPEIKSVPDPNNPGQFFERVYARTYLTTVDYNLNAGLPQFFKGTWNLAPTVALTNVDPAGSFVRSERTNGAWVAQSKRLRYGVGVTPTFFALFRGAGPVQRFRHAVTPTLSWGYSPRATVNPDFLAALGKSPQGYLGGLAQNQISLSLATNLEAKLRPTDDAPPRSGAAAPGAAAPGDTAAAAPGTGGPAGPGGDPEEGRKVRVASIQFTPLVYDFELARATGRTGFATERFGYTFRSDLLPGFDLGVDYSLFLGSLLSDTAEFKPYRESVRFGFQLTDQSAIVRLFSRLMGGNAALASAAPDPDDAAPRDPVAGGLVSGGDPRQQGMGAVTGSRSRSPIQEITSRGFRANFSVSQQRTRPARGGRVIEYNPAQECAGFVGLPIYDFCLVQAERNRPTDPTTNPGTAGGSVVNYPPRTNVSLQTQFNLTPKWSASWSTSYDVENRDFAAQTVTLQRDLHDWRAVFGFNRIPNGAFSFTFFISLKAQPELRLPYESRSYRVPASGPVR